MTKSVLSIYLKHVDIIKFSVRLTCDTSFDSPLKNYFTMKTSTLYLLYSSRTLTKSMYVDIPQTYRDYKILSYNKV